MRTHGKSKLVVPFAGFYCILISSISVIALFVVGIFALIAALSGLLYWTFVRCGCPDGSERFNAPGAADDKLWHKGSAPKEEVK